MNTHKPVPCRSRTERGRTYRAKEEEENLSHEKPAVAYLLKNAPPFKEL
jgi:hypothetical protein